MYPVNQDYTDAISAISREIEYYGTITFQDSTTLNFGASNVKQNGLKVKKDFFAEEYPSVGSVCCSELDLTIITNLSRFLFVGATVTANFKIKTGENTYESIPIGTFKVSEANKGVGSVELICYDAIMNLRTALTANTSGYPFDLINAACSACGVPFGNTRAEIEAMPNGTVYLATTLEQGSTLTWDDMVHYVATLLCGNVYCKYDGKMYVKPYAQTTSVRTFSQSDRYKLNVADYRICIGEIDFVDPSDGKELVRKPHSTGGSTTIFYPVDFGKNPMLPTEAATQSDALDDIATEITETYTSPFEITMPADPALEVGDLISIVGGQAGLSPEAGIIDRIEFGSGGSMTITGCGESIATLQAETSNEKSLDGINDHIDKNELYYYDYISTSQIAVADGNTHNNALVINYGADETTHISFVGQLKCSAVSTETYDSNSDTYTIGDIVLEAFYYVNGTLQNYTSKWILTDGDNTVDLQYFYDSPAQGNGTFRVDLRVTGGSITIASGDIRGTLTSIIMSNDVVSIEVTVMPNKTVYLVGETVDYTGIVVMGKYADRRTADITSLCTFDPAEGTLITAAGTIGVTVTLET